MEACEGSTVGYCRCPCGSWLHICWGCLTSAWGEWAKVSEIGSMWGKGLSERALLYPLLARCCQLSAFMDRKRWVCSKHIFPILWSSTWEWDGCNCQGKPHFGMCWDEHWDQPYMQGTGQPCVVCESSQLAAQVALQGLTCEKKTNSILVKEADLYSNEKMT